MVLTVSGPTSSSTYITSLYSGFFVEVPDLIESLVGLGVHPRDEEARHRCHPGGISSGGYEALKAPDVGAGYGPVALQREDEGDVDGFAGGDHILDSRQARQRRRYLHHQVRPVHQIVQARRLLNCCPGVVGQVRGDLQRDVAVEAVRPLEDGHEPIAGVPDIPTGELDEDLLGIVLSPFELL